MPEYGKYLSTSLLIYSMEQRSYLVFTANHEIPPHFMEKPGRSLPYSQAPATYPYPEPTPTSPHNPFPFPKDPS
jgi:hypothetical protein